MGGDFIKKVGSLIHTEKNNSQVFNVKGKWADLIAIEGDPLVDLDSMKNVRAVMKGGAFIKSEGIVGLDI